MILQQYFAIVPRNDSGVEEWKLDRTHNNLFTVVYKYIYCF